MKKIQTTCNYCSLACNMDCYVENNIITKIIPTKDYPVNKGLTCIKGLKLGAQQTVNLISQKPLLKINGSDERKEIPWDEAYKYFSETLKNIIKKYGKESVACLSTGQLALEEMALLGHVFRNFVGGQLDGNTRLCMATSVVAHKQSFGFDAPPYTLNDFELSDTIIFIGANPVIAHPILFDRIKKNKDKKIITIDIMKSETATKSDYFFQIKPKSDLSLLYTISNYLIEKNWIDSKFIETSTENFEEFKTHIKDFSLEKAEKTIGLTSKDIISLCELIHNGKKVSFWWTMGINQGYQAVRTAQGIINLALMTGNIGREGTGANSLTGQCNAMGSRLFSNSTNLYGGGDYSDENKRAIIGKYLNLDPNIFPTKPTLPYNEIIEKIISGEIKALWVLCTNPQHSFTNNSEFKKAFENLELLVVQDLYSDTDTSSLAHLYLPVVSGIKKEGTIINTERRVSKVNPVIIKNNDEFSDFEVIFKVGEALGMNNLLSGWETPEKVFNLMASLTKDTPCDMTGITYDLLNSGLGIQWPFKNEASLENAERRLYEDNKFYTPSKKAKFMFEDIAINPIECTSEFPYILNTGRGTISQWHTQTRTREYTYANKHISVEAYVNISKSLADELNILENDKIKIISINGNSSIFCAHIKNELPHNIIFAPLHYIETNNLTLSIYDKYSKEPSYKYAPIRIEKIT